MIAQDKSVSEICFLTSASEVVLVVKNLPASAGQVRDVGSILGSGRYRVEGHGNQPTSAFLLGESRGQWSLVGYSP